MRIVVQLDDSTDVFESRCKSSDIGIVVRPDKFGNLYIAETYPPGVDAQKKIRNTAHIEVEFVAHASKSGRTLQSEPSQKYGTVTVGIDKVVRWLENDLIPEKKIKNTDIKMFCCEGADDSPEYASLAEQMLRLFKKKPKQILARKGFVFIAEEVHSHSSLKTALYMLSNKKIKLSKNKPFGEEFIFVYHNNQYYKIDSYVFELFNLMKSETILDQKIKDILENDIEKVSRVQFDELKKYALKFYKEGKIHEAAAALKQGVILKPQHLRNNIFAFEVRDGLNFIIIQLLQDCKKLKHNKEILQEMLLLTQSLINYRLEHHYNLKMFPKYLSVLTGVVQLQQGNFSEQDMNLIKQQLKDFIKSIPKDIQDRSKPTGFREPKYFRAIEKVTKKKNHDYVKSVNTLLDQVQVKKDLSATQEVKLKAKEEIFDLLQSAKEREAAVKGLPKVAQNAYRTLETEMLNISLIWADIQLKNKNELLQMVHILRIMRKYVNQSKESIFYNPSTENVSEELEKLRFYINNSLKEEPLFQKHKGLSHFVKECSITLMELFKPQHAKTMRTELGMEKRIIQSHASITDLINKNKL